MYQVKQLARKLSIVVGIAVIGVAFFFLVYGYASGNLSP
jgi:hypothetical protein